MRFGGFPCEEESVEFRILPEELLESRQNDPEIDDLMGNGGGWFAGVSFEP